MGFYYLKHLFVKPYIKSNKKNKSSICAAYILSLFELMWLIITQGFSRFFFPKSD